MLGQVRKLRANFAETVDTVGPDMETWCNVLAKSRQQNLEERAEVESDAVKGFNLYINKVISASMKMPELMYRQVEMFLRLPTEKKNVPPL